MSDRLVASSLLIESADAITTHWADAMLDRAALAAPPVAAIEAEPFGAGTTSSVMRLAIRYAGDADGLPDRFVAKFAPPPPGKSLNNELFGYEREVEAYRFMGRDPPCRLPRCYLAEHRADGRFTLILEDLSVHCRPGDQVAGCSVDEARAVTRELAALHAATLNASTLASASWPRRRADVAARSAAMFAKGAAVMRERFGTTLGPASLETIEAVRPLVEPWSALATTRCSLIHTDPRVDNILFGGVGDDMAAWLIDLQQMALGDPTYDLAYFLTGSVTPSDRAACERELVALHASIMEARQPGYDVGEAWQAYRAQSIAGLVATVSAASALPASPATNAILFALATRNCAAVIALDGVAAVATDLDSRSGRIFPKGIDRPSPS